MVVITATNSLVSAISPGKSTTLPIDKLISLNDLPTGYHVQVSPHCEKQSDIQQGCQVIYSTADGLMPDIEIDLLVYANHSSAMNGYPSFPIEGKYHLMNGPHLGEKSQWAELLADPSQGVMDTEYDADSVWKNYEVEAFFTYNNEGEDTALPFSTAQLIDQRIQDW